MTAETASVDYDENLFLKAGFKYDPDKKNAPVVELNIIDESPPDENTEDVSSLLTAAQKQAALIAKRIKQFVGTDSDQPRFKIYDKQADTYRDVAYCDIVILLRSPVRTAADYIEMLRLAGIPVSSQSSTGYFASMEVTDIISLLRVLDNRRRDIELAAVLKSPLFAITDSHLAMIRTHCGENKKYDFYDCLLKYSQDGKAPALRQKLTSILTQLDNWAATAKRGNFADLIWKVYRREGYLSFVTALPGGRQRRANLLKLHEWAIQFERFIETSQTVSLARFVEFVEKLLDQQRDFSPAASETSAENAVRIMSIHKSKGLEFPVVFLADLHRQFNLMDTRADCVMDDIFGLGLRVAGSHSKTKLKSIAHQMITDKKRDTILAEEMRLLYVAITRARERLILTAAKTKTACQSIAQTCKLTEGQLKNWQLKSAKCFIDWILFALGDRTSLQNLFDLGSSAALAENDLFTARLLPAYDLETLAGTILQIQPAAPAAHTAASEQEAEKLLSRIRSSLTWQYDFKEATTLQAKTSVSQASHRDDEFSKPDLEDILQQKPKLKTKAAEKFDPAQIGSATHLLIEKLDLAKPVTAAAIRQTAKALCAEGLIEKDLADRIDVKPIQNFFKTELGKTATQHQNTLHREWPFTYAIAANELPEPTDSAETVIIQGIIDMIIETPQGIVIIDFKTDNVTAAGVKERKKRYSEQMRLYARAAGAILKKPVTGSWLYFLNAEKFAKME